MVNPHKFAEGEGEEAVDMQVETRGLTRGDYEC